jgi:hypothetical protein
MQNWAFTSNTFWDLMSQNPGFHHHFGRVTKLFNSGSMIDTAEATATRCYMQLHTFQMEDELKMNWQRSSCGFTWFYHYHSFLLSNLSL